MGAFVRHIARAAFLACFALWAAAWAAPAAARQADPPREKHVYTNDDWPFNESRPQTATTPTKTDAATASSGGERLAPFVTTPLEIVQKMLDLAGVAASDTVYDMGSGDGRIVIMAAQRYGARAVGVELDAALVKESTERIKELKLEERAKIVQGDLLQTDVKPATVVTVYLLPESNAKLRPILESSLRPGARVVAHDMRIPGWESAKEESVTVDGAVHFVYLYRIPEAFRR